MTLSIALYSRVINLLDISELLSTGSAGVGWYLIWDDSEMGQIALNKEDCNNGYNYMSIDVKPFCAMNV